jgi:anti-sigma factor RsiW
LRIAGPEADAVHAEGLRALAEALGLERRVAFLGALHGDALEDEYAAADIFALATHYEGYGMAPPRRRRAACRWRSAPAAPSPRWWGRGRPSSPRRATSTACRAGCAASSWTRAARADGRGELAGRQSLPRWEDRAGRFVAELEAAHG